MTLWGVVKRRTRRPQTSKRNGKPKVSRQICTPAPHGKEASSLRNLLLPSRPQLPNQQYPLLPRHLMASHPGPQVLHLLLPTPHRLPHQPWRLIPQTNQANPLYPKANVLEGGLQGRGQLACYASGRIPCRPQCRWRSRRRIESRSAVGESSLSRGRPAYPEWGRSA